MTALFRYLNAIIMKQSGCQVLNKNHLYINIVTFLPHCMIQHYSVKPTDGCPALISMELLSNVGINQSTDKCHVHSVQLVFHGFITN